MLARVSSLHIISRFNFQTLRLSSTPLELPLPSVMNYEYTINHSVYALADRVKVMGGDKGSHLVTKVI